MILGISDDPQHLLREQAQFSTEAELDCTRNPSAATVNVPPAFRQMEGQVLSARGAHTTSGAPPDQHEDAVLKFRIL